MMQGKFLMLAEKLGVESEVLDQIKKWFEAVEEKIEEKVEEKMEEKVEWREMDITKPTEMPMPSEEEINKMEKDELIVFAKRIIKKPTEEKGRANWQEHSPYMIMMKRQGY